MKKAVECFKLLDGKVASEKSFKMSQLLTAEEQKLLFAEMREDMVSFEQLDDFVVSK
jgi:hypothetical protein